MSYKQVNEAVEEAHDLANGHGSPVMALVYGLAAIAYALLEVAAAIREAYRAVR